MKNNDLKNKLDMLDSKLNLLLSQTPAERSPAPYTLHEWLEVWLATYKAPSLSRKWLSVLRCNVNRMKSLLPDRPLNEYTAPELLKAVYDVPMSYTRSACYDLLNSVFRQAVRLGYVLYNPLDATDKVKHVRKVGRALTLSEQAEFLRVIEDNPRRTLYLFYLLTGCRCSEALALRWADIDEEAGFIHVRGTKTQRADRYVPLFPQIRPLLAQLPHGSENLFPYTHYAVKSHFERLKRKYGFSFRLHDLRHTFATRCIESGISVFTVSKWLGHSSVTTTARIYAHLLTDFERQEIAKFNPHI